jgi:anaerobic magnesium-protoporphyrin IX monomethyl ester cyclase
MTVAATPAVEHSPFQLACRRERDASRSIVLVGFKSQGNLGLGYLTATLEAVGYHVATVDVESPREEILGAIRLVDPVVVGFSLIFQFYVHRFEALARYLRAEGVHSHFTIGGHFPVSAPRRRSR